MMLRITRDCSGPTGHDRSGQVREAFGRPRGCERESMVVQRDKVVKQEGNENPVGLKMDSEDKAGHGNYERMQV